MNLWPRRREFQTGNNMCEDEGWSALELRVGSGQGGVEAAQMGLSCLGELCMEVGSLDLIPRVVISSRENRAVKKGKVIRVFYVAQLGSL